MELPWLNEKALAEEQPRLFHYTSADNLPAILKSRGLFATHFNATNDTQEARYVSRPLAEAMVEAAFPKLLALVKEKGAKLAMSEDETRAQMLVEATKFFRDMLKTLPTPPHVTCFSAHTLPHHDTSGLLTMWRLYGVSRSKGKRRRKWRNDAQGIALGFNTEKLRVITEEIIEQYAVAYIFLDRVSYALDDPEVKRRVSESPEIADLFAGYFMARILGDDDWNPNIAPATMNKFVVLVPSAKHPDFVDERETRLVVCPEVDDERLQRGLPRLEGPKDRLVVRYFDALEEIIIGPSRRQDKLLKNVRFLLRSKGFGHIDVRKSQTPFRYL